MDTFKMLKTDYFESLNNWNEKQTDNWKSKFKRKVSPYARA